MKTVWINPLPSISESEQQEGVETLEGNNVIKVISLTDHQPTNIYRTFSEHWLKVGN
jgi:hypothetical protein|tara:strand:- start:80 stop:250 length:171 start_codon:yes stop_codon:yes gene_type:complete